MTSRRVILAALVALVACSRGARPGPPQPAVQPAGPAILPAPPSVMPAAMTLPAPPADPCGAGNVFVFASPREPVRGTPLRIIAVFEHPIDAELTVSGPDKATIESARDRQGGPPYYLSLQIDPPRSGAYEASFARTAACTEPAVTKTIKVSSRPPPPPPVPTTGLWPTRGTWTPSMENLYSAWIDKLFDAPVDTQLSWPALHEVLRDRARNFLFDHLGASEDEQDVVVRPDCADLPYFLRAYFAFKLRLPFGWSDCTRGEGGAAPTCSHFRTNEDDPSKEVVKAIAGDAKSKATPAVRAFGEFLRSSVADAVQSGAGRTLADDEESDYYPVALSVETLRPGTIFADPYGHVLVLSRRIAQAPDAGGILLAVDGQPDGTVARKRFWRGNFLFAVDPALGNPGFKRFRPLARDPATGKLRRLKNHEILDFSVQQYAGGVEGFYDKMDDVLSPAQLDPGRALLETLQALDEQVRTRVQSVDNGRKFLESGRPPAEMPDGAQMFETNGDWEDFSTPSRDLRLLIAIDVVRAFPGRVARRPERFAMPVGKGVAEVKADLEAALARELRARRVKYTRSDGSSWELTLEDVMHRGLDLEVAYNPNDCPEVRWGARPGTEEASTCARHAPSDQIAKMEQVRGWFHDRKRPAR